MNAREALVALNMIEHVGPVRLRQLLDHLQDAPAILRASRAQLQRVPGIGAETAAAIAAWETTVDLTAELQRIRDFNCRTVIGSDDDYPPALREIYDPPMVLYVKGRWTPEDRNAIALVGSRRSTHYGQETARRLAYQLAYLGVTVVSGGARGIDTAAHQGALQARGRTIAILGHGINLVFPPENVALFQRIAASGAVVTQFPFNRRGDRQSFPIRNRIVAGVTLGTVVVEAGISSGALITANMAVEAGRQVFAVPGRIDSPQSQGCHHLIQQGAKLCQSPEDILSEFEYLFPTSPARPQADATPPLPTATATLSEDERRLHALLSSTERPVDDLIQASGLPPSTVSVVLLTLEMKRLARQLPGKLFVRNG